MAMAGFVTEQLKIQRRPAPPLVLAAGAWLAAGLVAPEVVLAGARRAPAATTAPMARTDPANPKASFVQANLGHGLAGREEEVPDLRTTLPPPEVESDVVNLLADFPREERPYVQQVVHTTKDLTELNKQCAKKAAVYWQKGMPAVSSGGELDPGSVNKFNQGYLRYFDPLRAYLREVYKRQYALKPPGRFERAHRYWLAYLAFALENLDAKSAADQPTPPKASHSPVEVTQYRAWAYRLFKENGLDLTPYLLK